MESVSEASVRKMSLPMDSPEDLEAFGNGSEEESSTAPLPAHTDKGWGKKLWKWVPTSEALLEKAESKILAYTKTQSSGKYVDIGPGLSSKKCSWFSAKPEERKVWTVSFNADSIAEPLVLVHGLCASLGLWCLNVDSLASSRPVHAIDLLGFGRSSRPDFAADPEGAEMQHVEGLEAWRQAMKLEHFILCGHSMGGFISAAYALKYPERVSHLVLADPWGFPQKPENVEELFPEKLANSPKFKIARALGQRFNPLSWVRAIGPMGPGMIARARPDLVTKFQALDQDGNASVAEYIYHCNAQKPSGEEAFRTMMDFFGWAKNPMGKRLSSLSPKLPLTMIYGDTTWLQQLTEEEIIQIRPEGSPTSVITLKEAGHHVYADNQAGFNKVLNEIGKETDAVFQAK